MRATIARLAQPIASLALLIALLIAVFGAMLPGAAQAAGCDAGPAAAARANAASLTTLAWAPFGREERGWLVYANRIAVEIGTPCAATTPGFAAALAGWQAAAGLAPSGVIDPPLFAAMKVRWHAARPFVVLRRSGACPEPPPAGRLGMALPGESYAGKTILLRADALAAYRRMLASARQALPARDPQWFRIFSGFRDPAADALRCTREGNCDGIVRATCSPHRTGLAIDLHVGHAPGMGPDSSNDANRLAMVRTPAYRWLLTNAARFGFVNYVFEPWHWEYSTIPVADGKTPA